MATFAKTSFSHKSYASFRPEYAQNLYDTVLAYHEGLRRCCIDLGCGHGLVTRSLAKHFITTIGVDPSEGMLAQAKDLTPTAEFPNVQFRRGSAERLSFAEDGSIDVVVAGQAAHWFDYAALWPELRRVLRPGGTVAFWGYADCQFPEHPVATTILKRVANADDVSLLGPNWTQPGRGIVEGKYRAIVPPEDQGWMDVTRVEYEPGTQGPGTGDGMMFLQGRLSLSHLAASMRTWSAFHGWQQAHLQEDAGGDVVDRFLEEMRNAVPALRDADAQVVAECPSGLVMARTRQSPGP